jgi:cation transport protein ChaC
MYRQIYLAEGPSGPNKEYLFKLEDALNKIGKVIIFVLPFYSLEDSSVCINYMFLAGVVDPHVQDLANAVRKYPDTAVSC